MTGVARITVETMLRPTYVQECNEKIALVVAQLVGLTFEEAGDIVRRIEVRSDAGDVWEWLWRPTPAQLLVAMAWLR